MPKAITAKRPHRPALVSKIKGYTIRTRGDGAAVCICQRKREKNKRGRPAK